MKEHDNLTETELISCEICLKEIPQSEAKNTEASDYVAHFCGLECYEKWQLKDESEE